MTNNVPPRKIRGIRAPIPQGYVLGRISTGAGDVELIPLSAHFASPQYVAATTLSIGTPASGDVSGNFPGPLTVIALQGNAVKNVLPTDGQVLTWVGADTMWEPKTPLNKTWASFLIVDATHYYVMMSVSLADPEAVLDGSGTPVYTLNPGFTP